MLLGLGVERKAGDSQGILCPLSLSLSFSLCQREKERERETVMIIMKPNTTLIVLIYNWWKASPNLHDQCAREMKFSTKAGYTITMLWNSSEIILWYEWMKWWKSCFFTFGNIWNREEKSCDKVISSDVHFHLNKNCIKIWPSTICLISKLLVFTVFFFKVKYGFLPPILMLLSLWPNF